MTLSVSALLVGTGLTLIAIRQADQRLQNNIARTDELRWAARAGLDMALACTENVSDWRLRVSGNDLFTDAPVGEARVSVKVFDDRDGQIANGDADPVRIRVIARRDGAVHALEAELRPRPHPALKYAIFGRDASDLEFKTSAVVRGPVRSHGRIKSDSGVAVQDDASFETMTGYEIESPLTPRSYASTPVTPPQPDLSVYQSMATLISGGSGSRCELSVVNLSPTSNPKGSPNPNGIYWLRAGGREVRIENFHLRGTLIITETGGNKVTFQKGLWIEPGPKNYPVLLIDCPSNDVIFTPDQSMQEANLTINLIIIGIGLGGVDMNEDGDKLDTIPTRVRGLIWANADRVFLENGQWPFTGCLVSREITVDDGVLVDNDLTLLDAANPGFVQHGMDLFQGSLREVAP